MRKDSPHYWTHSTYRSMIKRCYYPSTSNYSKYGGAGITVCDRWRQGFRYFLTDMGTRPSRDHTLDRIDNSKGYEPVNCRWATLAEQLDNRESTTWLEYQGERKTLATWAKDTGIPYPTLYYRMSKGWGAEQILEQTPDNRKRGHTGNGTERVVTYKGETKPLTEWARVVGIPYTTLYDRLYYKGKTVEFAFTTPVKGGGWAK